MREMRDGGVEWIGKMPKDWIIEPLKSKFAFGKGLPITKANLTDCGYPVLSYGQIHSKKNNPVHILPELIRYVGNEFSDYKQSWANEGDILFADTSEDVSGIGNHSYVDLQDGIYAGYHTILARKLTTIDSRYFSFQFQTDAWRYQLRQYATGIKVFSITKRMLSNANVLVPPLAIQQRIADYLDDKCSKIDTIIAKQEKIIEKLKEYKTSAITEFVLKGTHDTVSTVTSGFPWIPMYNEIYKLVKIGQFCFVTKLAGFEYTNTMVSNITDDAEVPIVRAQNVRMLNFNDDITEFIDMRVSQRLSRCALDKKALLITFIGAGIGDVCVFDREQRYHLAPNVAKIEIRKQYKNILSEEYLMYYLASYAGKGEISKISKASAQPSLSMGTIRGITFTLPPIDEQKEIVTHLNTVCESIDKQVTRRAQLISKLMEYKKSLIYECVTGKKEIV